MSKKTVILILTLALAVCCAGCGKVPDGINKDKIITFSGSDDSTGSNAASTSDTDKVAVTDTDSEKGNGTQDVNVQAAYIPPVVEISEEVFYRHDNKEDESLVTYTGSFDMIHLVSEGFEGLNQAFSDYNLSMYDWENRTEEALDSVYEEVRESENEFWAQELYNSYDDYRVSFCRNDAALFSFISSWDGYMGGAHGAYYSYGYNLNPVTGEHLEIQDVCTDEDLFYEMIINGIRHRMETDEEVAYMLWNDWEDQARIHFNENGYTWVLTDEGLKYWFEIYCLAPYAGGELWLDFTMDELEGIIKPEYLKH